MPRTPFFPTTVDECKRIEISFLKKHKYLEGRSIVSGAIHWSRRGNPNGSIGILADLTTDQPYIRLSYTVTDRFTNVSTDINYVIPLVRVPSNLGKGYRWYFQCPFTGKRCSNLYKAEGSNYWKHREAFQGFFYDSQLTPRSCRPFVFLAHERKRKEIMEGRKRVNGHYRGQPTRLQRRLNALQVKAWRCCQRHEAFYKTL